MEKQVLPFEPENTIEDMKRKRLGEFVLNRTLEQLEEGWEDIH